MASNPEVLGKVVDRKVSMRKWWNYNFALRAELTIPIQGQAASRSVKAEGSFKRGHYQY